MIRGVMMIEGHPATMAKEFRAFVREEMQRLVQEWHRDTLPKHFEQRAIQVYKYHARSIKYSRDKRRLRPTAGPLVWSGQSQRQLMGRIRVSGTSKRVTGVMRAPRYFWMKGLHHPDMGAEVTAVIPEEVRAMAQLLNDRVTARLNKVKDRHKVA